MALAILSSKGQVTIPKQVRERLGVVTGDAMFYNSKRLHSYLGYVSPNEYQQKLRKLKKTA